LRYVGNREKPEEEIYDPVERWVHRCEPISSQTFLGLDDATLLRIAKDIPNPMFSDFHKDEGGSLFTPNNPMNEPSQLFYWNAQLPMHFRLSGTELKENLKGPAEVDFEVNMMEPLEGWKSWYVDSGILKSNSGNCLWNHDEAVRAECRLGGAKVPAEHHTCGIYGAENRSTAAEYGDVLGRVYGWGRYIRHEGGWKAEFAYPKCFYLREEQMNLVELLRQYHVPIYISQPILMYDPNEEGYDGYWNQEANWDSGAAQEAASGEARSPDEDNED